MIRGKKGMMTDVRKSKLREKCHEARGLTVCTAAR